MTEVTEALPDVTHAVDMDMFQRAHARDSSWVDYAVAQGVTGLNQESTHVIIVGLVVPHV
jgi:hypothetical protein